MNECIVLRSKFEQFCQENARRAGVVNSSDWRAQQALGLLSLMLEDLQDARSKHAPGPVHQPTHVERYFGVSAMELLT